MTKQCREFRGDDLGIEEPQQQVLVADRQGRPDGVRANRAKRVCFRAGRALRTMISRYKVSRILDRARATGLVRIEIGGPATIDVQLSERMRHIYGLRSAVITRVREGLRCV